MSTPNKTLIIGIGAVAAAGLVVGGAMLLRPDNASHRDENDLDAPSVEVSVEDRKKIEDLQWEEWSDASRYGFCLGDATVATAYSDELLSGTGILNRRGQEVVLFNKEAQRLYIVARYDKYDFTGSAALPAGGLTTVVPIVENGTLNERYAFGDMPVRIDYGNNVIYTDPDVKRRAWAVSEVGDSVESVAPRTGCSGVYTLDNTIGHDMLIGAENVIIDRECDTADISGHYSGEFSYRCGAMDARQARELAEQIAAQEDLTSHAAALIDDLQAAEPLDVNSAAQEAAALRDDGETDSPQASEEEAIRRLMQEANEDSGGSMRAP